MNFNQRQIITELFLLDTKKCNELEKSQENFNGEENFFFFGIHSILAE